MNAGRHPGRRSRHLYLVIAALAAFLGAPEAPAVPAPSPPGEPPTAALASVAFERPVASDPLLFPPEPGKGRPLAPLPKDAPPPKEKDEPETDAEDEPPNELAVVEPERDAEGRMKVGGHRVRIRFNSPLRGAKAGVLLPRRTIEVKPQWGSVVRWQDERTLELSDTTPLVAGQAYELRLAALEGAAGQKLSGLTLHADAQAAVGDKLLGYQPERGSPRLVWITSENEGSPVPVLRVLFDQTVAHSPKVRYTLADGTGTLVPLVAQALPTDRYEGVRLERGSLVAIRPREPLPRGSKLTLTVTDGAGATERDLAVAPRARITGLACTESDKQCTVDAAARRATFIEDDFRLGLVGEVKHTRHPERHVTVRPPVDDLDVSVYGDEIQVRGSFERSTTYRVVVTGLEDRHGGVVAPFVGEITTTPLPAHVTIPAGIVRLERDGVLEATTRNAKTVDVRLWRLASASDVGPAAEAASKGEIPDREPDVTRAIDVTSKLDAESPVPLALEASMAPDVPYVVAVTPGKLVAGAVDASEREARSAAQVAIVFRDGPKSMWAHARRTGDRTAVLVLRRSTGDPVSGATVELGSARATTDRLGFALVQGVSHLLTIRSEGSEEVLALTDPPRQDAESSDALAWLMTDRGVYRPGATIEAKTSLRIPDGKAVRPAIGKVVEIRLRDFDDRVVASESTTTSDLGSAHARLRIPDEARMGTYRLDVQAQGRTVETTYVEVAAYDRPRALLEATLEVQGEALRARLSGALTFGGPLAKANVAWRAFWRPGAVPGPWSADGFSFSERRGAVADRAQKGQGLLDAKGALDVRVPLPPRSGLPHRLVFVAEATDESFEVVTASAELGVVGAARTVGIRLDDALSPLDGSVEPKAVVVDAKGDAVAGVPVAIELLHVTYTSSTRALEGGGRDRSWVPAEKRVGACRVTSTTEPAGCAIRPQAPGLHRVRATIDGRSFAEESFTVMPREGSPAPEEPADPGTLRIFDRSTSVRPGAQARIYVPSPFARSLALVSIGGQAVQEAYATELEGAGELSVRIPEGATSPVSVAVTLFSRDQPDRVLVGETIVVIDEVDPVLGVEIALEDDSPKPRDEVVATVTVTRDEAPAANAEIVLAVVDEAVLRMTSHRYPDPHDAFSLQGPLAIADVFDSRRAYAPRSSKSHVAGDGGGDAEPRTLMRETAFFGPSFRTGADGKATIRFRLGDDLARYRVTAIALDASGASGEAATPLTVEKPVVVEPTQPRFVVEGDDFEVGARVANRTSGVQVLDVREGEDTERVTLAAGAQRTIHFRRRAGEPGEMTLDWKISSADGEASLDRVLARVPVLPRGVVETPELAGAFRGERAFDLRIPADVLAGTSDSLELRLGPGFPELAPRLRGLLEYPHGCVEQTSSSTLPLLVARDVLPRLGVTVDAADIDKKISFGLARLASMRTASGGLGYWPGDDSPHDAGTAYAARVVGLAREKGFAVPSDLVRGVASFAREKLEASEDLRERARWIEALDVLGEPVPPGVLEALYEQRADLSDDALAGLATALARREQHERARVVVDALERARERSEAQTQDYAHDPFGSPLVRRARIAIALGRAHPGSAKLPELLRALLSAGDGTTTENALSLVALGVHAAGQRFDPATVRVDLDGVALEAGSTSDEALVFQVPVSTLAGKKPRLIVRGPADVAIGFSLRARWRTREAPATARVFEQGPSIRRMYLDVAGQPLDPGAIRAGTFVHVVLVAVAPDDLPESQRTYLAITDPLPAGFEPVDPRISQSLELPALDEAVIRSLVGEEPSRPDFVELRDDRVHVYVDALTTSTVATSYLARAVTRGRYTSRASQGEWMYLPKSTGLGEPGLVVIQ